MSAAGKLFLGFLKWIVVPAGLGAVGYYYVGPTLGAVKPELLDKVKPQSAENSTETVLPPIDNPKFSEPVVEVSAKRTDTGKDRRTINRKKPKIADSVKISSDQQKKVAEDKKQKDPEPKKDPVQDPPSSGEDEAGAGGGETGTTGTPN